MTITTSMPPVRHTWDTIDDTRALTSRRVGPAAVRTPAVLLHGGSAVPTDPAATLAEIRDSALAATGAALLTAGHPVTAPYLGNCWGTADSLPDWDVDGGGLDGLTGVVDRIAPTDKIHLIGHSMGGLNAVVWATQNPGRVATLTLVAPVVDPVAVWDHLASIPMLAPIAVEMADVWTGDPDAGRAAVVDAIADLDPVRCPLPSGLAARTVVTIADDDQLVPAASVHAWAATQGVPDAHRIWTPTGGHVGAVDDPAWDDLTPLRLAAGLPVRRR